MLGTGKEKALTLAEAAKLPALQRNGKRPHIASLFRWTTRGVRGVRLESVQIAGSRCTSIEAVGRFLAELNGGAEAVKQIDAGRAHARAEKILSGAGI